MRKKLVLAGLGLAVVVAGVIAMAAFTAQMVNLQARVEKDIAVEPVICERPWDENSPCYIDPAGGDYGVVLPQEMYDKIIEVTLSNSFFEQETFNDLAFDILWECKQFDPPRDEVNNLTGDPGEDGIPDCRVHGLDDTLCVVETDGVPRIEHCDAQKLDALLRDHVVLGEFLEPERCLVEQVATARTPEEKKVDYVATGFLNKTDHKCRYSLKLFAPPCERGFNQWTDPHPLAEFKTPIFCHMGDKDRDGDPDNVNPQDLDEFADIGDEFKIQVIAHSVAGACEGAQHDWCVDADGIATRFDGIPQAAQVKVGDPVIHWAPAGTGGNEGIDMFDNDSSSSWTGGDDLHLEDPRGACETAIRDAHHRLGKDCKVLDIDNSLWDGQPVSCDLEGYSDFDQPNAAAGCPPLLAFHDSIPNGVYDNGEDIVVDANNNNVFD
jgi:hypothetical protein